MSEIEVIYTDDDGRRYKLSANNIEQYEMLAQPVYREPTPERYHPTGHPEFFVINPVMVTRTDFTITFQAHPDVDHQQYRMEALSD